MHLKVAFQSPQAHAQEHPSRPRQQLQTHQIHARDFNNNNKTLPYQCSLDVVPQSTMLPIQEATHNTVNRNQHTIHQLSNQDVQDLLNATLHNMCFTFENCIFRQTEGLPMGSSISGILAILFTDKLESIMLS